MHITYDIHNRPPMVNKKLVRPKNMEFIAVQIDHDFWLDTPLNKVRGSAGDYILIADMGFMMVVPQSQYANKFQEITQ